MARLRFAFSRGPQIKHMKAVLQCMAKLGPELMIEASADKLTIRVINTAKSAFLASTFGSAFFDAYELLDDTIIRSAVLTKTILATFRTQRASSITWDLEASNEVSQLSVTIAADSGLVKTYGIECLDSEILVASLDKDRYPTSVVAEAGALNKLLSAFQSTLDEITIIANPESLVSSSSSATNANQRAVQFQSFVDPEKVQSKRSLHTSVAIDTRSLFHFYQHASENPSDVTFNIKDFRAMVALCEHLESNVLIRFDGPGMPLVAEPSLHNNEREEVAFTAELVLSTLMESQLAADLTTTMDAAHHEQQQKEDGQQRPRQPHQQAPPPHQQATGPLPNPPGEDLVQFQRGGNMAASREETFGLGSMRQGLPDHVQGGRGEEEGFEADDREDASAAAAMSDDEPNPEDIPQYRRSAPAARPEFLPHGEEGPPAGTYQEGEGYEGVEDDDLEVLPSTPSDAMPKDPAVAGGGGEEGFIW